MKRFIIVLTSVLGLAAGAWFMSATPDADGKTARPARSQPSRPHASRETVDRTPGLAAPSSSRPSTAVAASGSVVRDEAVTAQTAAPTSSRWHSPAEIIRRRYPQLHGPARLPVVFAIPPEEVTGLNPGQIAAAIAIAEQFQHNTGGDTADPSTADYLNKWRREQPLADYQLRAAIGAQAYARWQEEAHHRARSAAR
jgi:hypothetical protein